MLATHWQRAIEPRSAIPDCVGVWLGVDAGRFERGAGLWYVVNDLVASFCCLECLNIDFQQLNGRSVGVGVAMVLM